MFRALMIQLIDPPLVVVDIICVAGRVIVAGAGVHCVVWGRSLKPIRWKIVLVQYLRAGLICDSVRCKDVRQAQAKFRPFADDCRPLTAPGAPKPPVARRKIISKSPLFCQASLSSGCATSLCHPPRTINAACGCVNAPAFAGALWL